MRASSTDIAFTNSAWKPENLRTTSSSRLTPGISSLEMQDIPGELAYAVGVY